MEPSAPCEELTRSQYQTEHSFPHPLSLRLAPPLRVVARCGAVHASRRGRHRMISGFHDRKLNVGAICLATAPTRLVDRDATPTRRRLVAIAESLIATRRRRRDAIARAFID